jgi:hypothetical protein
VGRHLTLSLKNVNFNGRLAVRGRTEGLTLFRGNGGIFLDQFRKDATQCLDPQGERRHVQKQNILHIALQHTPLNGGADGHHFIGVHPFVGLFSEDLGNLCLNPRHPRHAAHQNHVINIARGKPCIFHGHLTGGHHLFNQVFHQPFQLGAGQFNIQVLGPLASAVMKGRFTSVSMEPESSVLAFSAPSFNR